MEEEYDLSLRIKNKELIAEYWNRLRIEVENSSDGIIRNISLGLSESKGVDGRELTSAIERLDPKERRIIDRTLIRPIEMEELPLVFNVWFFDSKDKFRQMSRVISMVVKPPQRRCGLLGICPKPEVDETEEYFEAHSFTTSQMDDLRGAIEEIFESENLREFRNLKPYHPEEEVKRKIILCKICEKIRSTRFGFYEISDQNPNVMLELGMAIAFGKPSIIIVKEGYKIPSNLRGVDSVKYKSLKDLKQKLKQSIHGFLQS